VVFAELPAEYQFPERERIVALWHGVLNGERWQSLEKLPMPSGLELRSFNSSPLVRLGDTLSWALTYESASGDGIALFERRSNRWSVELISVPDVATVSLGSSRQNGIVMLPVRGGSRLAQSNSLFLYTRRDMWRQSRQLVAGGTEPVFDVQVASTGARETITWWSLVTTGGQQRREARTILSAFDGSVAGVLTLDTNVARVIAVPRLSGDPLWIVHGATDKSSALEIRIVAHTPLGRLATAQMPDPFNGPFAVLESEPSRLLFAGPSLRHDAESAALHTLLLRLSVDCGTAPSPG
jgi:hypothetical protein